jgi:hypothetical protein
MPAFPAAVFAVLLLGQSEAATSSPQAGSPASTTLPSSLSKIRAGLKKPEPRLTQPTVKADFRVEIAEEIRFEDLLSLIDFGSTSVMPSVMFGSPSPTQPLVSYSLANQVIGQKFAAARRARAERLAREEVRRALEEACKGTLCADPSSNSR